VQWLGALEPSAPERNGRGEHDLALAVGLANEDLSVLEP
jgi:hypothetical protein